MDATRENGASRIDWRELAVAGIVVALLVSFLAFQATMFFPSWSDENIHTAVAAEVVAGRRLYTEVLSARPPMSIWPLVWLQWVGLSPLAAARALTLLATVATMATLIAFARRRWGPTFGWAAGACFLASPDVWGSYAYTGIGLTTLWCAAAVLLVVSGAPVLWASVAAGLAVLTGQHCAVLLSGAVLYLVFERGWKPALGFVIGTVVVAAMGLAFVGRGLDAMWTSVVMTHRYHLGGADLSSGGNTLFTTWALDQLPLLWLAGLALSAGRLERWLFGLVAAHIAVVAGMGSGQELYLYPTLPLIALLAARGAGVLAQRAGASAAVAGCLVAGVSWFASARLLGQRDHTTYPWLPPGRIFEMARLASPTVAARIADELRTSGAPSGPVFGHATISNLVALDLGRHIAGGYADLDPRWPMSGAMTPHEIIENLERDELAIVVTPNWYWNTDETFRAYWRACFDQRVFEREEGSGIPRMFVYTRRPDAPHPCFVED